MPIKQVSPAIEKLAEYVKNITDIIHINANVKDGMSIKLAMKSQANAIGLCRSEDIFTAAILPLGNKFGLSLDELELEAEGAAIGYANAIQTVCSIPRMHAFIKAILDPVGLQSAKDEFVSTLGEKISSAFWHSDMYLFDPPKTTPFTYRLSDLELPQLQLEKNDFITPEYIKTSYILQARALFKAIQHTKFPMPLNVLIPTVRSADEVAELKQAIAGAAKEEGFVDATGKPRYRFGAMIETKEAVQPRTAAAIAKLCDFVSFGTNDLTKELTDLPRNDIDDDVKRRCHEWMVAHHCERMGDSPFDVLVPPVKQAMQAAVKAMRRINPTIEISCCGRQVANNIESIESCIDMGINAVSVPPQDVAAAHIIAAHHAANKQLTVRR